jgi:hypothetical protein
VTSRQRKHQRGKKNAAYQCHTKPIKTKIRFHKIKHAPHQNFTHHTSQSRFNAIAIAIAAKSNSGIRLQFVNNMHSSNKKTNFKTMQNQHRTSTTQIKQTINNRNMKLMMTIMNSNNDVIVASIVHATITRLMSSNMRKKQRITTSSARNETKIFPTLRTLLS